MSNGMHIPDITELYLAAMQRGRAIVQDPVTWTAGSQSPLVLTPQEDEALLVASIKFLATDDFDFSGGATMQITPWGNLGDSETYEITSLEHLLMLANTRGIGVTIDTNTRHVGEILLKPPVLRVSSTDPSQSFGIVYDDNEGGGSVSGSLQFTAVGWKVVEEELGFSDDFSE